MAKIIIKIGKPRKHRVVGYSFPIVLALARVLARLVGGRIDADSNDT